jgi:Xaa-Pro aminopeptidase
VDHRVRRRAVAARLDELGVDALLVTSLINTRYLTGYTGSNGQLLIGADMELFLTDGRYASSSRREVADIERFASERSYRGAVAERCEGAEISRLGVEAGAMTIADRDALDAAVGDGVELIAVHDAIEEHRRVKDDEERDLIRQAQAATDAAFVAILDRFAVGVSEQRVARELEGLMIDAGADGLAFDPIVAFGENAAEPHHEPNHRTLEEGDVIKLDMGALVEGYRADMTRTVAFGQTAAELRKIHDIVRQAQQAAIDAVRPGVTGIEVDAVARSVIADAGYGDRFVHGLGHGVGLEIHEQPWLGATQGNVLPEGAVVTVEPGIYVEGIGGVRIEDMVEITGDGCIVVGMSSRDMIEV